MADPRTRTRDGRIVTGFASPRENVNGSGLGTFWFPWYSSGLNWNYGYPYYNPWLYGNTRWTWGRYGLWYDPFNMYGSAYDPWFYDPYAFGSSMYGYQNYSGYSGYSGGYSSSSSIPTEREVTGSLRLRVKPSQAKVYLDGTLIGTVDDFDGLSSHLAATAGKHQIELRADGYEPLTMTVNIEADKTITARASLKSKR